MLPGKRTYVDFEPFSKWNKGEDSDTIELHVQGFRKDQLRVQVNSLGTVLVTGERQLEDKRWSRFRQEFKLTKEYCLNSIHAKLGNSVLHVTVPRKEVSPPRRTSSQQAADGEVRSDRKESYGTAGGDHRIGDPNGGERLWLKGSCWRLGFIDRRRVLQVSVAVLAAAAIGVGTFLAAKYWFNHGDRANQSITDLIPSKLVPLSAGGP